MLALNEIYEVISYWFHFLLPIGINLNLGPEGLSVSLPELVSNNSDFNSISPSFEQSLTTEKMNLTEDETEVSEGTLQEIVPASSKVLSKEVISSNLNALFFFCFSFCA